MKILLLLLILFSNAVFSELYRGDKTTKTSPIAHKPQHDPPKVVNEYTAALAFHACKNESTVANASAFKVGDTGLVVQMKCIVIDTGNTAALGTILDYKNAGNYEFNYIRQKSVNELTYKNQLTKYYDMPGGVVLLIRVPFKLL